MKYHRFRPLLITVCAGLALTISVQAQSSRPRRVTPPDTLLGPEPKSPPATDKNAPLLDVKPAKPVGNAPVSTDTTHAYQLFQQKQYAAAAQEAKQIANSDPGNSEAWKLAGFSEFYLKQYADASDDLKKALDLQRKATQEDSHTVDALAESYVLAERFDQALPLLVTVTTRPGARPDPSFLYYRGLAEFKTGKAADAERSFNAAVKADPKNAPSLFYLGRFAFERKDFDAAIAMLNRATASDQRAAEAWTLLTYSYLNRGGAATGPKADADYLAAVRAGESLVKLRPDENSTMLYAQALIGAKQYARAASVLEPVAAKPDAKGATLYLLGFAQTQVKNYPKAIAALERAAQSTPNDANIYRMLGYDYEVSKQYAKALAAYEKGLQLAPADPELKESADRVRPFAKS
ncbi:MAG TPA: tetratricopeptide repeat protein [Pyrinomonadaceae bacterium]|nr:tetratricopeptide repeat protein [Pyrinomonadaceae bacterium]